MSDTIFYNVAGIITLFLVPILIYSVVTLSRTAYDYKKEIEKLNERVALLEAKNKG